MMTTNLLPIHILFSQEFAVKNVLMVMINSERFRLGTVSQLDAQCTCPIRILRRIASISAELDFPWDFGTNLVFSRVNSTLFLHVSFQIYCRLQLIYHED